MTEANTELDRGSNNPPSDKYADLYKFNEENDKGLHDSSDKNIQTDGDKNKSDSPTDKKLNEDESHKDPSLGDDKDKGSKGWQKRVDTLTKRNKILENNLKQYEAKMAAFEEKINNKLSATPKPKMTRDNFPSEEEWMAHIAKENAKEIVNENQKQNLERERKNLESQHEEESFKQSWEQTVRSNFEDPEELKEFASLINENSDSLSLHKDIEDFIDGSHLGARILREFLLRPDVAEQFNNMKPVVRAANLMKMEQYIQVHGAIEGTPYKSPNGSNPDKNKGGTVRTVTKAPAPIGNVGSRGSAVDEENLSDADQFNIYTKKKYGKTFR